MQHVVQKKDLQEMELSSVKRHAGDKLMGVKRQFVPSDVSSQATIRPKLQKATIRPKRQFVPF